jgi:hypothetical protein
MHSTGFATPSFASLDEDKTAFEQSDAASPGVIASEQTCRDSIGGDEKTVKMLEQVRRERGIDSRVTMERARRGCRELVENTSPSNQNVITAH